MVYLLVLCHRHIEGVSAPLVSWDSRKVGRIAAEKMLELGHRNVAYIGMARYIINECQLNGLRDTYSKAGIEISEENILFGADTSSDDSEGVCEKQVMDMITKPDRPSAIFCSDIQEAEKVYILALSNGIKIPEDISLLTCCDKGERSYLSDKLARVEKYEFDLGFKAAELIQKMHTKEISITSDDVFTVDLKFVEGLTLSECIK